jgi:hypothetical protein
MSGYCLSKPEAKVETYLVEGTKARKGWAVKVIDLGRRGAPDRELRFQGAKTIFAETKADLGRLESWQKLYHEDLRSLGYVVLVIWTIAQVDKFFSDYDRGVYG